MAKRLPWEQKSCLFEPGLGDNNGSEFRFNDSGTWLEYFGLAGAFEEYDEAMRIKSEMAREYSLGLVSVFPKDLYPECKLDKIISVDIGVKKSTIGS